MCQALYMALSIIPFLFPPYYHTPNVTDEAAGAQKG